MQWIYSFFYFLGIPQAKRPPAASPTLSASPETRHVLASVKAKEIAQQQSKRGKKEKMRNKEKKGERRTPKADDSRNFDADDDAVILANTNTILHTISVWLGECYPL